MNQVKIPEVGQRLATNDLKGVVTYVRKLESGRFKDHHVVGMMWDTGREGSFMLELTQHTLS